MESKRKTKYTLISIFIIIVIMFVFERMTLPPTTPGMQTNAEKYLKTSNKNTPTLPFTQDGCSLFFDSFLGHDFSEACLSHDIRYWAGGPIGERKLADIALRDQIAHTGPLGPILAPMMYVGVRVFGNSPVTKTVDAHWGYGWNE